MDWFTQFPHMDDESLRALKKAIDEGFRTFTRTYGDAIEGFFEPLQFFLIQSERFMTKTPWPIILVLVALIAWGAMLAASDPALADGLTTSPLTTVARMLPLWYPAPLLAAAGLGLISSVVLAMYSGGFALQSLRIRARRSITTLVAAVLVAVLAAGMVLLQADAFVIARDLATTLAVPVAAWAGIFAAEMMIRTRRFDAPSLLAPGGVYPL